MKLPTTHAIITATDSCDYFVLNVCLQFLHVRVILVSETAMVLKTLEWMCVYTCTSAQTLSEIYYCILIRPFTTVASYPVPFRKSDKRAWIIDRYLRVP